MSKPIEFRKSNAGEAMRRGALKVHRLRNEAPDPLHRFDKVVIGKVGVARRRPVSLVTEQLADERQVLARHDRLTGGGMLKVMQAKAAELRIRADRAPAIEQRIVPLAVGIVREHESVGVAVTGQRRDVRLRRLSERHRARPSLRIA